jgi:hypothetical protein
MQGVELHKVIFFADKKGGNKHNGHFLGGKAQNLLYTDGIERRESDVIENK